MNHILHLAHPAAQWDDASPVGNGSLGAMLFGGTQEEQIYLSEETLWSGGEIDAADPAFRDKIDALRALFLRGELETLDDEAEDALKFFSLATMVCRWEEMLLATDVCLSSSE